MNPTLPVISDGLVARAHGGGGGGPHPSPIGCVAMAVQIVSVLLPIIIEFALRSKDAKAHRGPGDAIANRSAARGYLSQNGDRFGSSSHVQQKRR